MTVSRIREGRGNQLLQHLRIKVKHKVVRTSVASANIALMLGLNWRGEGFSTFMASYWLQCQIRASDWLLLMLCGANRESCNRKLKHQQRLTYLAKTAAHHAAVQSAVLFHFFPSSKHLSLHSLYWLHLWLGIIINPLRTETFWQNIPRGE